MSLVFSLLTFFCLSSHNCHVHTSELHKCSSQKRHGDFKGYFCTNMSQTIYYSFPSHIFLVPYVYSSVCCPQLYTSHIMANFVFPWYMSIIPYTRIFGCRGKPSEKSFLGFMCTVCSSKIGCPWILLPQIYSVLVA